MTHHRRGLTLVELLVSVALGTILIGIITFIWLQSTKIFSSTVNNLESYQRLRTAMDQFERDIANCERTIDMEFFKDLGNKNGHFDAATEKVLGHMGAMGGEGNGATSGATSIRELVDSNDPVRKLPTAQQTEFFEGGYGPNGGFSNRAYFYAPTLFSPPPYAITGSSYLERRHYWRDELYLRTVTALSVEGAKVPALVHYRLVQPNPNVSTSLLRRRVWWQDPSRAVVGVDTDPTKKTDLVTVLASGICDLKFGYYFRPSAVSGIEGKWFHVGCPTTPEPASGPNYRRIADLDADRGFLPALVTGPVPAGTIPPLSTQHYNNVVNGVPAHLGGANGISFYYEGFGRFEQSDLGVDLRTIKALNSPPPSGTGLSEYTNFDFPGVRPGDSLYIYGARDDDSTQSGGASVAAPTGVFPDRVLTVDDLPSRGGFLSIKIRERIEFDELKRYWIGTEFSPSFPVTATDIASNQYAGPVRTITASINVGYRVSFLPAAIVVRVSLDDAYNQQIRIVERVIRLVQR